MSNLNHSAHSHPWKISDVVLFPLLALGLLAEFLWGGTLYLPRWLGVPLGIAGIVCGFALINWSKSVLDKANQPSLPAEPTTDLITAPPFNRSRNPNYLGALITGVGAALALDAPWVLLVTIIAGGILDFWMIRPEERYLSKTFGAEYDDYASKVRRWF